MTSWTIISGTFRTFCKKSYNFLYNSLKIQRSKNIGDTTVHCPAEAAQQSLSSTLLKIISPPSPNASFCTHLCLWPLHGQVSLDKGSLAQCCGIRSVAVARCKSWGRIRAGASTFMNRGLRLRYWVVIVQVIIVGLRCFSTVFMI